MVSLILSSTIQKYVTPESAFVDPPPPPHVTLCHFLPQPAPPMLIIKKCPTMEVKKETKFYISTACLLEVNEGKYVSRTFA